MSMVYSHGVLKYYQEDQLGSRRNPETLLDDLNNFGQQQQHRGLLRNNDFPSTSSEMETMFAKLVSSNNNNNNSESIFAMKKEERGNNGNYSLGSKLIYQHHQIQMGDHGSFMASENSNSNDNNNNNNETKMGSNLIRQKSYPPGGFFSDCSSLDNNGGFHGTLNFSSSKTSSCNIRMPQIAERGNEEGIMENNNNNNNINNSGIITKCYMPSYSSNEFWDGSSSNASKSARNIGEITFSTSNALDKQDAEFGNKKNLTHHLSLPSSSTKIYGMEKLYEIQRSVPCKVRAKRGFATHPRSIAERERRTRISERIKKLQELFPTTDKQISTADMLDAAVQYIKDMQKQVKILTNARVKCTCSSSN